MGSVFESYFALTEQETSAGPSHTISERAAALEDRVAMHVAIFEALERRIGGDGLTAAHGPLIPLYQRWPKIARQLVVLARELRAAGRPSSSGSTASRESRSG